MAMPFPCTEVEAMNKKRLEGTGEMDGSGRELGGGGETSSLV